MPSRVRRVLQELSRPIRRPRLAPLLRAAADGVRRRKAMIAWLLAAAACAGGGFLVYMKLVEKGFIRYNKWDRRVRGTLRAGDIAPDLPLTRYDGAPVRLSELWESKPLVLVFGSCT
jgi:cytochrome oxidase Cu insertion factor (SCO1/SenC/PrrC family)